MKRFRPSPIRKAVCWLMICMVLSGAVQKALAPVPVFLGLALKCVAIGALGTTGIILLKCEPDYYLCRYRMDGEDTYWAVSQASVNTLKKTGGVRCEGPSKTREELDWRAWANMKDPEHPMFPCSALGTPLPQATWTNYSIVSLEHSMNGGGKWKGAGNVLVSNDDNWAVALLGPTGTNGFTKHDLWQLSQCDVVVTNALPTPNEIKDYAVRGVQTLVPDGLVRIGRGSTRGQ